MKNTQVIKQIKETRIRELSTVKVTNSGFVKDSCRCPQIETLLFRSTSTTQIFQHKVKVAEVLTCVSVFPQLTTVRKQNLKRALETCTGQRVSVTNDLCFIPETVSAVGGRTLTTGYKINSHIDFTPNNTVAKHVTGSEFKNLNRLVQTSETPGVVQPYYTGMVKSQYLMNYSFLKSAMATGVAYKLKTGILLKSAPFDAVVTDRDSAPGAFVGFDKMTIPNLWRGTEHFQVGKAHRMFKFDGTSGNVGDCGNRIGLGKSAVFTTWSSGYCIPNYKIRTRLVRFKS